MSKRVIVTAGLSDYKLTTKLMGLLRNNKVDSIFLVRKKPINGHDKIININPPVKLLCWLPLFELWRMITLTKLAVRNDVIAIIGIQLIIHGIQARLAGWFANKFVVLSVIGTDVQKWLRLKRTKYLLYPFVCTMNAITVMGERSKSIILACSVKPERIYEIQNYQDVKKFSQQENGEKKWDLIFIGSLLANKGVDQLLSSLSTMGEPRFVIIAGEGPEKKQLMDYAARHCEQHTIEFVGHVYNVQDYLVQSRVLVLPSKSEALPAVAIEAMYCGVPAILTNVGDISGYFIDGETCLIYEAGDIEKLSFCITQLLDKHELYSQLQKNTKVWSSHHKAMWSEKRQVDIWNNILKLND